MTTTGEKVITKTCSKCGKEKPATTEYFPPAKQCKYGIQSQCRDCFRAYLRDYNQSHKEQLASYHRDYYKANSEKKKQVAKEWRENNPDRYKASRKAYRERNRESIAASKRAFYLAHKADVDARTRAWRNDNRDKVRSYGSSWNKRHQRFVNTQTQRRRAKRDNLPNDFTVTEWNYALLYFGGACAVCGYVPDDTRILALDHWIPINSETCPGTIARNIVPLCHSKPGYSGGCNNSKSDKMPEQWLSERYSETELQQILTKIKAYFDGLV